MSGPFAPDSLRPLILESLADPELPAHGQVATTDALGRPHVRSVHLRFFEEFGVPSFSTNTETAKWEHLRKNPHLAGCYLDMKRKVQLRWEGGAELWTWDDANSDRRAILRKTWETMSEGVRRAYWHAVTGTPAGNPLPAKVSAAEPPPIFAHVICHPTLWDIHEIVSDNYLDHRRAICRLEGAEWKTQEVWVINGKPL